MNLNRLAAADRIHALVRLALDVHLSRLDPQQLRQIRPNLLLDRSQLGPLKNHRRIQIPNDPAPLACSSNRLGQKDRRILPLMPRIRIREKLPDIRLGQCPKNRIRRRMKQRIPVRMPYCSAIMLHRHTPEDHRTALSGRSDSLQPVQVVPVPNPNPRLWN